VTTLVTGTPLWLGQNPQPVESDGALAADITADVAVIGGGITGALVAYALTSAGAAVVVLDRAEAGAGSTSASSGLLLFETDASLADLSKRLGESAAVRIYRLGLAAIDRIEQLCAEIGDSCGFVRRPSLYLASSEDAVAGLEREVQLRRRHGFDSELLAADEIARRYRFTAPAAVYSHGSGEIDTVRFARALLAAARRRGVHLFTETAVERIDAVNGGVTLHTTTGRVVRAGQAIWATGYAAFHQLRPKTARLASTWVIASRPVEQFPGWPDRCLIWETARPYFYMRTTDDGRVIAGGGDEPAAEAHRDLAKLAGKREMLARRARERVPGIPVDVEYAWGGTFAATEDGLPYIGRLGSSPAVWLTLAYGGNGITFSVVAANIVRDDWMGRTNTDAALFRIDR
jgi:glycine/D-amino acid oxidase-like deaminating enzyme